MTKECDPGSNLLYLADDASANWLGGFTPTSSGSASNSQRSISGNGASLSTSGTQLALTVPVTFTVTFPITVWAQNGTQQQGTMVLLTVVAASPSTMISPAPGSNLASNSPTFLWNPGTGASQNQCLPEPVDRAARIL